jgi:putative phosphoserine phosphatase/1-acylglycerol-3-phosphate O-acyltransferase
LPANAKTRDVDSLIADVYKASRGPRIAAFVDYDGTLIEGYSVAEFYRHRLKGMEIGPLELARTVLAAARGIDGEETFTELLEMSLQTWVGRTEEELMALGNKLFKGAIAGKLHSEMWRIVEAHRAMGHTVVLASSATRIQVEPMARALEAQHVICSELEFVDGIVTGRVRGAAPWGVGKARAVRELAAREDISLEHSFAYSNGDEDVPFLESAGRAIAVEPQSKLLAVAERRGWPVLRCRSRGSSPIDVARTVGFYGGMAGALGIGIGVGLLNRSKRQMLDVTIGTGTDIGLALAGIDVKIVAGHEYLWSARPCVFVFNHRSKLDAVVMMNLARGGFTGVAKKEARNIPGFGQLFWFAGVAFVDRGNTDQARRALEPAVKKIKDEGLSLVIAPEGTRSTTPRLGRFKKGAFHIAMQAGVPMVPVVMRNADELQWRGGQAMHAGSVEVVVLPPVETSAWTVETINEHVQEVREMFVQTLDRWPGAPVPPEPRKPRTTRRPRAAVNGAGASEAGEGEEAKR